MKLFGLVRKVEKYILILLVLISSHSFGKEVILIRHAEVNIDSKGWMFPAKAIKLRVAYDTAAVYPFCADTVLNKIPEIKTDTIYTSNLTRSVSTAFSLFGKSVNYVSTSLFNEFQLNILRLPIVLPFKVWTGLSRFGWFMGIKREDSENIRDARIRTDQAADYIEEKIHYNEQVVLVTHGFLNRNIKKELKRRGWKIIQNEGHKNLGATVLTHNEN